MANAFQVSRGLVVRCGADAESGDPVLVSGPAWEGGRHNQRLDSNESTGGRTIVFRARGAILRHLVVQPSRLPITSRHPRLPNPGGLRCRVSSWTIVNVDEAAGMQTSDK